MKKDTLQSEKYQVVLEVARDKQWRTPKGTIDWKAYVVAHPEHRKHICYGADDRDAKKAQNVMTALRKQGLIGKFTKRGRPRKDGLSRLESLVVARAVKATKSEERQQMAAQMAELEARMQTDKALRMFVELQVSHVVAQRSQACQYCPRCGNDLRTVLMAQSINLNGQ